MSWLAGMLTLNDTDRVFTSTQGQRVVYDAIATYLNKVNADLNAAQSVFVEGRTTDHIERYRLPGGGRLQRRGGFAQSGAVKNTGSWDVAYPLEDFGAQIAENDITMAYMTVADMARHVDTVVTQAINTRRFEMLKALFGNADRTFVDPLWGSLTIKPGANGDAVVYPPVLGSESEATEDHYLETNYTSANISDTNNPLVTIRNELEEHFGAMTGGENIVVFINNAQRAKIEALSGVDEVTDNYIQPGTQVNVPVRLPNVPGRVIARGNGVWVVEWRWIPANYLVGVHLEVPAPLKERVDPADTGLGTGLQLVARESEYPIESAHWRDRFGYGVGNRLNLCILECGTGGTYSTPAAFA